MNKFYMMVGLPASGKSTVAKKMADCENVVVHSSDALRAEMFGGEEVQGDNDKLFRELHRRIKEDLSKGLSVVYDACNINYKRRMAFLKEISYIKCKKVCVMVATPFDDCIAQNQKRDRVVPYEVIRNMYLNFNVPMYYEGWDDIYMYYRFGTHDVNKLFNGVDGLNKIDQGNPHHTLTIGMHCLKCVENIDAMTDDYVLHVAALFHDIGKRFTKQWNEKKQHYVYYQHHNVSAYDTLFYARWLSEADLMEVVNIIQWHMQPFFINSDKERDKFKELVGEETYNKIMLLNEADKMAK